MMAAEYAEVMTAAAENDIDQVYRLCGAMDDAMLRELADLGQVIAVAAWSAREIASRSAAGS